MTIALRTLSADVGAAWRRDGATLLPLVGLAFFLPQYAVQLLLPGLPTMPEARDEAAVRAWAGAIEAWVGTYGAWYLLAPLIALFGGVAMFAMYLARERPTLGRAMARGAVLFPRYLLASILVSLPMGAVLSLTLLAPMLLIVAAAPIFYIYARTMLAGPVIVAEAPVGAMAAIARSWALTRGHGMSLATVYATLFLLPGLVGAIALSVGSAGGGNPVIVAITAAIACAATAAGAAVLTLVQVAVYRRVAR